jgi:hypothetical protein
MARAGLLRPGHVAVRQRARYSLSGHDSTPDR